MIRTDKHGVQELGLPYCALTMGFAWKGQTIFNPLRTPDDSADCAPEFYGFELVETGGGCEAHVRILPSRHYLMLTDSEGYPIDMDDPDSLADASLGRYSEDGDELAMVHDFTELPRNGSAL